MIDHDPDVREAHENDDLLFGTVESWIVYVSVLILDPRETPLIFFHMS